MFRTPRGLEVARALEAARIDYLETEALGQLASGLVGACAVPGDEDQPTRS
jgi:hypothetical protein